MPHNGKHLTRLIHSALCIKGRTVRLNALFTILFVGCLAAGAQATGSIILSGTWTGEELRNDPREVFPTRTPTLQGTSLLFGTGSVFAEKLLELELFPQNALNPADPMVVHILANFTVQQSTWPTYPTDHDPGIGVGDGTLFGGFLAADNYGGDGGARLYHDLGTAGEGFRFADELFTGAGYPAIGNPLTIESRITLTTASTDVWGAFGSKSGSHTFPEAFDVNAPLNFVFFAHDAEEKYKLNWLSLEVDGTRAVPEPSSLVLFSGFGVMGLVMVWRRRKQTTVEKAVEKGTGVITGRA